MFDNYFQLKALFRTLANLHMGVGKRTGIRSKWRIFPQKVMLLQQQYAMADIFKIKAVGNSLQ